ncbi:hypothetical protein VZO05_08755 [Aggregatilineales bacterium SYSU G02658]
MNKLTRQLKVTVRSGKAELDLPDFPDGEVVVHVERPFNPDTDWTPEEWAQIEALIQPDPKPGAEVVAWMEAHPEIFEAWSHVKTDGVAWIEEQRAKRRQRKGLA